MNSQQPITPTAEICRVIEPLSSKFVVDFVNGIEVVRDHVRVQKKRNGFSARLFDGFTGQGARRQAEVNAHFIDTVEGALTWLNELTESLTLSNLAIVQVRDRVNVIVQNVTSLASYSLETRRQIEHLASQLRRHVDDLTERIDRIEMEQHAKRQLDVVMSKWAANRFVGFAIAERCFLAMEELRWGAFGDYCATYPDKVRRDLLSLLVDRVKIQLEDDLEIGNDSRPAMSEWLKNISNSHTLEDTAGALQYLGDWSSPEDHPFVFTISQHPHNTPLVLPKLCNAGRLSSGVSAEIFGAMIDA